MNIKEALLKEHSKKQAELIGRTVIKSDILFKSLIKIYFGSDQKLAQRAAWALSHAVSKKPEIIFPYLKQLISHLHSSGLHDAVIRNGTKILETICIPEKHLGIATDLCFKLLSDQSVAIASKCYVMTTLCNITKKEPELRHELKLVIESQLPFATAAFQARSKRTLNILSKIKN
jgi:hypothetical protein